MNNYQNTDLKDNDEMKIIVHEKLFSLLDKLIIGKEYDYFSNLLKNVE